MKIIEKARKYASQRSTWIGVAALAAAIGFPDVASKITEYGNIVLLVLGGGLIARDTAKQIVA